MFALTYDNQILETFLSMESSVCEKSKAHAKMFNSIKKSLINASPEEWVAILVDDNQLLAIALGREQNNIMYISSVLNTGVKKGSATILVKHIMLHFDSKNIYIQNAAGVHGYHCYVGPATELKYNSYVIDIVKNQVLPITDITLNQTFFITRNDMQTSQLLLFPPPPPRTEPISNVVQERMKLYKQRISKKFRK